ncbi:type II toxin-antitoxin system RelE/ParE family toxin [Nocardiopsis sp. NPDC049922]|uniref:type II toxin-antitoxin system RelE/ParE family toxin n=1 Tax=Nocardiopsis sp. NPDC049922 TaxID=3155157 RepID=UPI0033E243AE
MSERDCVWDIYLVDEVREWLEKLRADDEGTFDLVEGALFALSVSGPALKRPLVGTIAGSTIRNLKELRPGSTGRSEVRILFVFDPWRSAILLVAGDKAGHWNRWYDRAVPAAERRFHDYVERRSKEEER